jgi:WD40 repeat protein
MAANARLASRSLGTAGYWAAALNPALGHLYCGGTDGNVHVYDAAQPGKVPISVLEGHGSYVTGVTWAARGGFVVSAGYDRRLICRAGTEPSPRWTAELPAAAKRLAASPDGQQIAAALDDLRIGIWETASGKLVRFLEGQHAPRTELGRTSTLYCLAWRPEGALLASGGRAGDICLWETSSGKLSQKVDARTLYTQAFYRNNLPPSEYEWGGVRSVCFSADGAQLFAGGMGPADHNSAGLDGLMQLLSFDLRTGKLTAQLDLEKSKGVLSGIAVHRDGKSLVAAGGGGGAGAGGSGTLCLWRHAVRDAAGKPQPPRLFPSAMVVRDLALTHDGRYALLVGMEKSVNSGRVEWWELAGS